MERLNNVVFDLAIADSMQGVNEKQKTEFEHQLEIFNRRMRKSTGTELHGKFTSPPKPYSTKAKEIVNGLEVCEAVEYAKNKIGCNWWSK